MTLQVTDGRDVDGNTDTSVDASIDVSITVTDVNEAPEFESSEVGLEIDENPLANADVGDPIEATDPESDDLSYTLSGVDSALFTLDASSGQISVGPTTILDHESPSDAGGNNVYDLTVSVSDGKDAAGNDDTIIDSVVAVAITVSNVDEPPAFGVAAVELEVAENTATNTDIGTPIRAVDPRRRRRDLLPGRRECGPVRRRRIKRAGQDQVASELRGCQHLHSFIYCIGPSIA